MTWGGAAFPLAIAIVTDLLRTFFNFFWFLGPALAALYCAQKVSEWVGSLWGLTETVCAGLAVKAGAVVSAVTIPFGTVMAFSVAVFGFLALLLIIVMRNRRLFKTAATAPIQFGAAFALSSVPLVGALPFFTFTIGRLYGAQIKTEQAEFKKWEKQNAAAELEQRRQQAAYAAQLQAAQQTQFMQQEAANEAMYEQEEAQAANDEKYNPQPLDKAA